MDHSPWSPLRTPMFRAFWIASLISNLGTWIHEVGAGWLMASLDSSPEMVAAVRTAMAIPIVLLAIPAGVVADRVDRRQLLIFTQLVMFATTATLAAMTYSGVITSWMLLALTVVMGMSLVLHVPTWQASIPELVPKREMSRAVALGSVSFNLARTAGPAVGGLLIAGIGKWAPFAVNALSFGGVLFVLLFWRRERKESSRGLSFGLSLYQGVRYVVRTTSMRNVMLGVALFIVPGSALWALLPLVAKTRLGWGADGFGLLVACVGGGALLASQALPKFQSRFGSDKTVAGAMVVFAGGLFLMSQSTTGWIVATAAVVMGAGWMTTLTTLNATAQVTLPSRLRARGMSCYLTAMALSMSAGSFLWGQVAGWTNLSTAQSIAAATLLVTAAISLRFRLGKTLA
ncbi:MAG: MFS transporter [Pirellulaceae bacterium]